MKKDEVNALIEELERDWPIADIISFNELNLGDKLQNIWPYELMRFSDQLLREKAKMGEIVELKNRVYKESYHKLRFDNDRSLDKKEIEQYYLPAEPNVITINRAIEKQQLIINFFETCIKSLEKIQWNAKLFHEDRKYSG